MVSSKNSEVRTCATSGPPYEPLAVALAHLHAAALVGEHHELSPIVRTHGPRLVRRAAIALSQGEPGVADAAVRQWQNTIAG